MNKLIAEALGTFFLLFIAISTALFAGSGVGLLGISLAFGLSVTVMAYAVGSISGCHLNPAVTVGLCAAGSFPKSDVIPYVIAQVVGGIAGAGAVYMIAKGGAGLEGMVTGGFASNGFAEHSPNGYSMQSVMIVEVLATAMFVFVIAKVTSDASFKAVAPLCIGIALALAHFVAITISNASINPARSTATAVFAGGWAIDQLWAFWVAPLAGGVLGGLAYKHVS